MSTYRSILFNVSIGPEQQQHHHPSSHSLVHIWGAPWEHHLKASMHAGYLLLPGAQIHQNLPLSSVCCWWGSLSFLSMVRNNKMKSYYNWHLLIACTYPFFLSRDMRVVPSARYQWSILCRIIWSGASCSWYTMHEEAMGDGFPTQTLWTSRFYPALPSSSLISVSLILQWMMMGNGVLLRLHTTSAFSTSLLACSLQLIVSVIHAMCVGSFQALNFFIMM